MRVKRARAKAKVIAGGTGIPINIFDQLADRVDHK